MKKLLKILAIILGVIMLLPILPMQIANAENIPDNNIYLDLEIENRLIDDFVLYMNEKYDMQYTREDVWIQKYYGRYSGCEVLFIDIKDAVYPCVVVNITIAGYEFGFPNPQPLCVYKNSNFMAIQDAYETGWLTDADICEIWKNYNNSIDPENKEFDPRHVLVGLKHEYSSVNQDVTGWFEDMEFSEIKDIFAFPDKSPEWIAEYEASVEFHQILTITLAEPGRGNVLSAIRRLKKLDFVLVAEPDYNIYVDNAAIGTNDPESQWGLENINVNGAWDKFNPNVPNVQVAVIDSGISLHNDLNLNVGVGQDYYFYDATTDDDYGHGTHVAGIIGAVGNNGIGVSGVAQRVQLIPYQVSDNKGASGYFNTNAINLSIASAQTREIPIINASFGVASFPGIMYLAIQNYTGLFVCSTGNSGTNNDTSPQYPSNFCVQNIYSGVTYPALANIISVANITSTNTLSADSNYGATSVHIGAPGNSIISTLSSYINGGASNYGTKSGTSMAAPHVAGVAALLKGNFPDATAADIKVYDSMGTTQIINTSAYIGTGMIVQYYKNNILVDTVTAVIPGDIDGDGAFTIIDVWAFYDLLGDNLTADQILMFESATGKTFTNPVSYQDYLDLLYAWQHTSAG